ncbi:crotonase/enoyl-CoA hydratase family protein [Nakamurella sp. PAMC28650]|uniref:crotonase/enoyl-CoA hydratase family protein n=1 Tax=Nakamurella sp. PAMC28650 TaxID=2762325 RepID=UPI00164CF4EE|nr:crotonase/enoyl-CoA hydratase family protein [Nakamurella sp. PAMC28650]QNK81480.1 crotonase/enoyl-CoA hydratase family protein [Nakamurella sp. PAMC28650]
MSRGIPELVVERRGRVLIITMNRPEKRNAMNGDMARALAGAVDELDADPDLSVGILTGAGGSFSAGMDLSAFLTGDFPEVAGRGLGGITLTPPATPLIAAVEGYALAGGLELALACDMIVAAENSRFGLPEAKRGLVAGSGGLLRLPLRIPPAIAMEYALTGDTFDGARAAAFGLVNSLTPPGGALTGALELAARVSANGPMATRITKEIITQAPLWDAADRWDHQQRLLDEVFASHDAHEGAQAFMEKRAPNWLGR